VTLLFPDLSEWEPNADIPAILAKTGGAIILRVAYGNAHKDLCFDRYRAAAHNAGAKFVGIYQYIVAGQDIPSQVAAYVYWVGTLLPGEIPICDLEVGAGSQLSRGTAWLGSINSHYNLEERGTVAWLYSYVDFITQADLAELAAANPLWIASYSAVNPDIEHVLWQSTNGTVGSNITDWTGIGDQCDTNMYAGTIEELTALAWHLPVLVIKPTPPPIVQLKGKKMIIIKVTSPGSSDGSLWTGTRTFLYSPGVVPVHIESEVDQKAFADVLPEAAVTWAQYVAFGGV
jgi:GH25 family lysozyme M1 (1,4-beta-N-acetylmuramidase)